MTRRKRIIQTDPIVEKIEKEIKNAVSCVVEGEELRIGDSGFVPYDESLPAIIIGVEGVDKGIWLKTIIYTNVPNERRFFFKYETRAMDYLARFANLFSGFEGNLNSLVGRCALVRVSVTSYGLEYLEIVREITKTKLISYYKKLIDLLKEDDVGTEEDTVDDEKNESGNDIDSQDDSWQLT